MSSKAKREDSTAGRPLMRPNLEPTSMQPWVSVATLPWCRMISERPGTSNRYVTPNFGEVCNLPTYVPCGMQDSWTLLSFQGGSRVRYWAISPQTITPCVWVELAATRINFRSRDKTSFKVGQFGKLLTQAYNNIVTFQCCRLINKKLD